MDTRIIVAYMVFRAHDSLEAHIRGEVMAEYILDVGSVISQDRSHRAERDCHWVESPPAWVMTRYRLLIDEFPD